jgi:hypothetical protein
MKNEYMQKIVQETKKKDKENQNCYMIESIHEA